MCVHAPSLLLLNFEFVTCVGPSPSASSNHDPHACLLKSKHPIDARIYSRTRPSNYLHCRDYLQSPDYLPSSSALQTAVANLQFSCATVLPSPHANLSILSLAANDDDGCRCLLATAEAALGRGWTGPLDIDGVSRADAFGRSSFPHTKQRRTTTTMATAAASHLRRTRGAECLVGDHPAPSSSPPATPRVIPLLRRPPHPSLYFTCVLVNVPCFFSLQCP